MHVICARRARCTAVQCRYTCSSVYRIAFVLSQMSEESMSDGPALGGGASGQGEVCPGSSVGPFRNFVTGVTALPVRFSKLGGRIGRVGNTDVFASALCPLRICPVHAHRDQRLRRRMGRTRRAPVEGGTAPGARDRSRIADGTGPALRSPLEHIAL